MNYSPPRGDKTRPREEAQPRKQVPGAEICLLITGLGRGWARPGPRFGGRRRSGRGEKMGLIRGGSRRPPRAICQTPGLGTIRAGPAGLACVCTHALGAAACLCERARTQGIRVCAGMYAVCARARARAQLQAPLGSPWECPWCPCGLCACRHLGRGA